MSALLQAPAFGGLQRISGFMRLLRDNDFRVGIAEAKDAARILASTASSSPGRLREALRALCCSTHGDWQRFDRLFDAHFLGTGMRKVVHVANASVSNAAARRRFGETAAPQKGSAPDRIEQDKGATNDNPADGPGRKLSAARSTALGAKDLRKIVDADEIAAAKVLAERLAKAMRARLTRRNRARRRGTTLDLRRTLHASIAFGGEPIRRIMRQRKPKQLRLVMLMDASGSMELYTPYFVRFMHGVIDAFREAEAFVFHTKLVHIAAALRERDAARAIDRMGLMAQGMGGGTRIAESLNDFNRWHAKRVIHSRTCVMILSDGFDTGTPGALGLEMGRLRRRCKRIVWLNPLLGWRDYAPSARGMTEALPFIDLFAPAHSLASLAALEPYLARL